MIETMYIGSGDIHALMAAKNSKTHAALMQRFVSGVKPYYNAYASPIDALRTGAILEDRFLSILPDDFFSQYVVENEDMDVFKCSLDFARIEGGKVAEFIELKTLSFSDYIEFVEPIKADNDALVEFVKKKHKPYYYQVQEQLYCTGLQECRIAFLSVTSYDDDENYMRDIQPNEYTFVRISRDEAAIDEIKERGMIFQQIKDFYK